MKNGFLLRNKGDQRESKRIYPQENQSSREPILKRTSPHCNPFFFLRAKNNFEILWVTPKKIEEKKQKDQMKIK
jgi:hypothetical protein